MHPVSAGLRRIVVPHPYYPVRRGVTGALGRAQNKSLRIVAGAFKSTPIRNLETETWVPPLDLYLNKRLADFELRLHEPALDDGKGDKKSPGSIVHAACNKLHRRFNSRRRHNGRPRATGAYCGGTSREHNSNMDWKNRRHGRGSRGSLEGEMAEGKRRPSNDKACR